MESKDGDLQNRVGSLAMTATLPFKRATFYRMRAVPEWCVALKLFDISSWYNLSVSSAWLRENSPPTASRVGWCLTPF